MTVTHPLADDHVRRLDRAARVLPRHQREELLGEIRSHLDAGPQPGATGAEVRNLLDELGSPAEIVAAARPEHVPVQRGAREVLAIAFLLIGGLVLPVIGWFIGFALLLASPLWYGRQKLLGSLVWPGGFGSILLFGGALGVMATAGPVCSGPAVPVPVHSGGGGITSTPSPICGGDHSSVWAVHRAGRPGSDRGEPGARRHLPVPRRRSADGHRLTVRRATQKPRRCSCFGSRCQSFVTLTCRSR